MSFAEDTPNTKTLNTPKTFNTPNYPLKALQSLGYRVEEAVNEPNTVIVEVRVVGAVGVVEAVGVVGVKGVV